ncbi:MAG: sulfite exporter TauE/SafE family protein [Deltaproteobacteria bacterium]|jgi:uncharacterized membrane protein YfcA|nr:sulfite exporter TauE/SafE family protein [Deltaproteobacteria bacterium]
MITALLVYLACGVVAGILAGLLGVGGGLVIVPMLVFIFPWQGVPAELIQLMALGTSLATITITSISSFRAHDKRGAVRWDIWRSITPGILIGTFGGGFLAAALPVVFLRAFFVCFLYYVAIQMFLDFKPKAGRHLPGTLGMNGVGGVIGVVSSLVGIGGGTLSVPFMSYCNVPMHTAVGTSAAIGFPIAVAGTVSFIWNGLSVPNLPPYSLGYVSLVALTGIAAASYCMAPLGAKLSHSLPVSKLKRIFAVFLVCIATRMLWTLL